MHPQLQIDPGSPEAFIPALVRAPDPARPDEVLFLLAPAAAPKKPLSLWQRIDWTAVGAAAFVYAMAFAAWLLVAR